MLSLTVYSNFLEATNLLEAVLSMYGTLRDEIDPKDFRQVFVERKEIKAKDFDNMCKSPRRRDRAVQFMQHLTKLLRTVSRDTISLLRCFLDALVYCGYNHLANSILSEAGT